MSDPFADPQQNKPVIKLTDQVQIKSHEEDEDVVFKMRAKLFRFDTETTEWKERGTGELRLFAHKEHKKLRLVMRRDKTLKVCANHLITEDMKLQPNIGSDRSWVYRCHADISEGEPSNETLAVRFGNSENANLFKEVFEKAQEANAEIFAKEKETQDASEEKAEEATTPTKETVELKPEESSESKPAEEEAKTEEVAKEEAA
ncbi:hypothetical protein M422DRAFT_37213 [Sphaerobolus stellatus SS14]|uniref:RanBD1 domain-containing protein n=1 Tax=Sphaerobolus stellatus (strain SS14) TaxID=990650 RepID=A0A0C9UU98_SPHS4|nr:hypothetical protein M422DRAFT_37213 [Sphaerobolus stellatus SS14]